VARRQLVLTTQTAQLVLFLTQTRVMNMMEIRRQDEVDEQYVFCALPGDLRPLDTAIMNASVSIDRVIWSIVTGPYSTALVVYTSCKHGWGAKPPGTAPSQSALYFAPASYTARRSIRQMPRFIRRGGQCPAGRRLSARIRHLMVVVHHVDPCPLFHLHCHTQTSSWDRPSGTGAHPQAPMRLAAAASMASRHTGSAHLDAVACRGSVLGLAKPAAPHASVRELESPHWCSGSRSNFVVISVNAVWQATDKDKHCSCNKWCAERVGRVSYTGLTSGDAKFAIFVFSVDHSGKVSSFPASRSALHGWSAMRMGVQTGHGKDLRTRSRQCPELQPVEQSCASLVFPHLLQSEACGCQKQHVATNNSSAIRAVRSRGGLNRRRLALSPVGTPEPRRHHPARRRGITRLAVQGLVLYPVRLKPGQCQARNYPM